MILKTPNLIALIIVVISIGGPAHAKTRSSKKPAPVEDTGDMAFVPDDMADDDEETPAAPPAKKPAKPTKPSKPVRDPEAQDEQTEAGSGAPAGPQPDSPCLTGDCPAPVINKPGLPILDAILDTITPERKLGRLQAQNGNQMSCAQVNLLQATKQFVRRRYGNRQRSAGDCGGGVGESILSAGIPFERSGRYAYKYRGTKNSPGFLEQRGFLDTKVKDVEHAPDGSVLVFAGPCTPGWGPTIQRTYNVRCQPGLSAGETAGHVTIKGSTAMDGGKQWYYTDARQSNPAIARRYFIGAFLPPGSDKGPCSTTR